MTVARRDALAGSLERWVHERHLQVVVDNLTTAVTWVDLCAPQSATPEQLLLAGRDLLVVFFSLDDCSGERCEEYFAQCERILSTGTHGEPNSPLLDAYRDTVADICSGGGDASYKQGKADLIAHYRWRAASRGRSSGLSLDEYLQHRRVTIYTKQWIDTLELIMGCNLVSEERDTDIVRSAVDEMVEWQLLQNDLVSVERDVRRGEPNIVVILQHHQGGSLGEARQTVAAMRDACRSRLNHAIDQLRSWAGADARKIRYFEILDDCLRGTLANYRENLTRYELDETLGD